MIQYENKYGIVGWLVFFFFLQNNKKCLYNHNSFYLTLGGKSNFPGHDTKVR